MFQLTDVTEAKLATVTNRIEKHGDEDKPAVTLGLEVTAANTLLDLIDPKIREALFKPVEGQEDLPGVERSTPVLRCNAFDRHTLETSHEGWTLNVDESFDESDPMIFGSVKVDKFSVEAKQGGSIVLRFRAGTSDVDADKLGKLAMHNGQSIWITLIAPKPKAEPIDGTVEAFEADHPEAGDMFATLATEVDNDGPEDEDSDGGHPDIQHDEDAGPDLEDRLGNAFATADQEQPADAGEDRINWPFPKDEFDSTETAPQSVTIEPQSTKRRTKRGREATAAAIAAGLQGAAE